MVWSTKSTQAMQWIKISTILPPEELKDIPAVASSLEEALNSLEKDYEFLTQGGVFTKDFIEAFINIKRKEVERLNMTPHPVEFEMYYA